MLINTIQEGHTLGDSSIQSASGILIDANSGDDGSARFFREQEAFLAQYEIEIELDAHHRQFAPSTGSGMFTTANTNEPSTQYPEP